MYRTLCAIIVAGLICGSAKVSIATRKPADAGKAHAHTVITNDGLHVSLPSDIPRLPAGLLPEP